MAERGVLFFDEYIQGSTLLFAPLRPALEDLFKAHDLTPFTVLDSVETAIDILKQWPEASWFVLTHYGRFPLAVEGSKDPKYVGTHLIEWVRTNLLQAHTVLLAHGSALKENEAKIGGANAFFCKMDVEGLKEEFSSYLAKMPRAA